MEIWIKCQCFHIWVQRGSYSIKSSPILVGSEHTSTHGAKRQLRHKRTRLVQATKAMRQPGVRKQKSSRKTEKAWLWKSSERNVLGTSPTQGTRNKSNTRYHTDRWVLLTTTHTIWLLVSVTWLAAPQVIPSVTPGLVAASCKTFRNIYQHLFSPVEY